MCKKVRTIAALFLLMSVIGTQAQYMRCWLCKNRAHTAYPPYEISFKKELPYLAVSTAFVASGVLLLNSNDVNPYTLDELNGLNAFDINALDRDATGKWSPSLATVSDIMLAGALISPGLFITNKPTRLDFAKLMLLTGEVLAINWGLTETVKNLVNRTRPYVYNPSVPIETRTGSDSRRSFFSGHVSTAAAMTFFVASVLDDYHPEMRKGYRITVWSLAFVYPATVAFFRVMSGQHYPTDVITGYAAGMLTGWLIPRLHKKHGMSKKFSIAPVSIFGNAGVSVSYAF